MNPAAAALVAAALRLNRHGPALVALGLLLAFGYGTWVWRRRRFESAERDRPYRPPQGSNTLEFHPGVATAPVDQPAPPGTTGPAEPTAGAQPDGDA